MVAGASSGDLKAIRTLTVSSTNLVIMRGDRGREEESTINNVGKLSVEYTA